MNLTKMVFFVYLKISHSKMKIKFGSDTHIVPDSRFQICSAIIKMIGKIYYQLYLNFYDTISSFSTHELIYLISLFIVTSPLNNTKLKNG
jgi:hypothetical protein